VVVTGDHGVTPFAAFARRNGFPLAENVSLTPVLAPLRDSLAARAGPGRWILFWSEGLLVLDRPGLTRRGVEVDSVVQATAAALRAVHGVLRVDTRASLAAADTAQDAVARRWLNAVPPGLGAELMVTLEPMYSLGTPSDALHGMPSQDDTHVPLLFAGPGIRAGRYTQRVSVVDIAPTVASLLGVRPTEPVQGRVLQEALTTRRR